MKQAYLPTYGLVSAFLVAACGDDAADAPLTVDSGSPVLVGEGGVGDAGPVVGAGDAALGDAGGSVPFSDASAVDAAGPGLVSDAGGTDASSSTPSEAGAPDASSADGGKADAGGGGCGTDTYANFGQAFFMMHCTGCHGAQAATSGGNLRLDSAARIRDESDHILEHAVALNPPIMPLGTQGRPQAERDRLKKWLDCGAP